MKELYDQCFRFVDQRMKLIDKPGVTRQTAMQTIAKPTIVCRYCKKPGHTINECLKAKSKPRVDVPCRSWNPLTKTCTWEKSTGGKCKFKHTYESASSVESESPDSDGIAWMISTREKPKKNTIAKEVFKTLQSGGAKVWKNHWVIDGAATVNLSNGINFIPGTKRAKSTIIEVVGRNQIECAEVADYSIEIYLPSGTGPLLCL